MRSESRCLAFASHPGMQDVGCSQAAATPSSGTQETYLNWFAFHAEAAPGGCEVALKAFNKAVAELGRLVKAGAVNLTADAAAGAPFKLDAAALAAQPCHPQARHALLHRVLTHRMQLDRAPYLGSWVSIGMVPRTGESCRSGVDVV